MVRPKKSLGQHFLTDRSVAERIVESFQPALGSVVVEIGPGTGALTRFLVNRFQCPVLLEVDAESVNYLLTQYKSDEILVRHTDFLASGFNGVPDGPLAVIGNFPYNISSQIFFKILEHRDRVGLVVGMIQKEVAQRIAAPPGSRTYGILSVLLQAYYDIKIMFHVPPGVFHPPPKVMSSVIRLERNRVLRLPCDEALFVRVVKTAFGQRRKTLRNALKGLNLSAGFYASEQMGMRAEQLSVADFVELVNLI